MVVSKGGTKVESMAEHSDDLSAAWMVSTKVALKVGWKALNSAGYSVDKMAAQTVDWTASSKAFS